MASQTHCYFYSKEGGYRNDGCPFKHTPSLSAGRCVLEGTLAIWKHRDEKGKSFGFIDLGDGNKLFCPERAFVGTKVPTVPCLVRITSLKSPAADTELFVADQVHRAAVEVD